MQSNSSNGGNMRYYNLRGLGRLNDDPCYVQTRQETSLRPLRYYLNNEADFADAMASKNLLTLSPRSDIFVPIQSIDDYNNLLNGKTNYINERRQQCKFRDVFIGQLPLLTMPARSSVHHGDTDVEDYVRLGQIKGTAPCNPKMDGNFYDLSFTIFPTQKPFDPAVQYNNMFNSKDCLFKSARYGHFDLSRGGNVVSPITK